MASINVSPQTIADRIRLLTEIARDLLNRGILPEGRLILREARIALAVRGYFLLNRAYKDWRIPDGHFTERPKIAALQCTTIARLQPFLPINPLNAVDVAEARCNEILACTYALSILEVEFKPNTPEKIDFFLRLLDIISKATVETIEPFLVDVNHQIERPLDEYTLAIHSGDKLVINSLISIFELISTKGELLK